MTTTIPTPSISFIPFALTPSTEPAAPPAPLPAPRPLVPPAKAPSNDDAERVAPMGDTAYRLLLSDPRVRAYLWARLGPIRIARTEKEELIDSVFEVLWKRRTSRDPVRTLPRMLGFARTILEGKLVDYWRHQDAVNEDIVDAPQTCIEDRPARGTKSWEQPNYVEELRPPRSITPEDSLHTKQQMQYVNEIAAKIGLTNDDVEVMFAIAWDETATYDELAAERGVKPGALRTRIHRLQKAVREGWNRRVKRTLILTLLLLAMLLLYVLATIGPARNPPPAPLPEPTVHEVAPVAPTTTAELPPDVPTGRKPHVR